MIQKTTEVVPEKLAPDNPPPKKKSGCLKVCLILIFIFIILPVVSVGGFFYFETAELRRTNEQVLKTYQPSAEVAEIAKVDNLTSKGKATFYRADPRFVNSQDFIKYCQQLVTGAIEGLACIAPKPDGGPFGGRQIFLLQINDPQFIDHKYSAAAHEMLHNAYNRLNQKEKKRINLLLNQELENYQDDPHLLAVMDIMKKRGKQSSDLSDELHSKIGVEFAEISPGLEEYYKQYFIDRQKVVKLYREGGFNSRVRRLDEIKKEIDILAGKINPMRDQMTNLKNSGDIDNYNSLVPQFNSLINQYNALVFESKKNFNEVQAFYRYFNPNYQPPEEIE